MKLDGLNPEYFDVNLTQQEEMMNLAVKICCIQNIEEANLAIREKATAVGLVSEMPSGFGEISEEIISQIASNIPGNIESFLLTSKQEPEEIIYQHQRCQTSTLQIVDRVSEQVYPTLRKRLAHVSIVQVIHVEDEKAIERAVAVQSMVDAILLDSGSPDAKVKRLGGTGRIHNWDISREIVQSVNIPVYLAGGLTPENVYDALRKVRPFGIDVCSGVRTQGKLDEQKLRRFMTRIHTFERNEA